MQQNKIEHSGIADAFQLKPLPVYVVTRHGRSKKCFSRETAISRLCHFMVQKTFDRARIETHENANYQENNGCITYQRGEPTIDYWQAHYRCVRRVRKLLARRREKIKWQQEHDDLASKYDDLMKRRPF